MLSIEKIKEPVAADLDRYEDFLRSSLYSEHTLTQAMLDYIFENRGKAIRPLLVLLCAAMSSSKSPLPEQSYLAAMLIEMIHTASLVHDDVIDQADIRRGRPSVNAMWQSKRSVVIGDYILAKSFTVGMRSGSFDLVTYVTQEISALCEGELIQSEQSERHQMSREIYCDIIYKKTATLIGTSCGAGAMSAGASKQVVDAMKEFGDCIGMAFQIKDDMLDYSPSETTGKPLCGDLREGKITLPLLTLLERADEAGKRKITRMLEKAGSSQKCLNTLCNMVREEGGLDMAAEMMNGYVEKARLLLSSYAPSPYRDSLDNLCLYVARRDK